MVVAVELEQDYIPQHITIPIQKIAYQYTQVDSQAEATGMGNVGSDHVAMPLDNMFNYGYVGEFYLGSDEPQQVRVLFDTGSANSWILSKQAIEQKSEEL